MHRARTHKNETARNRAGQAEGILDQILDPSFRLWDAYGMLPVRWGWGQGAWEGAGAGAGAGPQRCREDGAAGKVKGIEAQVPTSSCSPCTGIQAAQKAPPAGFTQPPPEAVPPGPVPPAPLRHRNALDAAPQVICDRRKTPDACTVRYADVKDIIRQTKEK